MDINDRLVAILKTIGRTHATLSDDTGLSTRQISRILSKDSVPSVETVQNWTRAFGLDPSTAMARNPAMLDIVMIGMASLDKKQLKFVCEYVKAVTEKSS